ncbi:unnamed protein product [Lathyrus oleraceus]
MPIHIDFLVEDMTNLKRILLKKKKTRGTIAGDSIRLDRTPSPPSRHEKYKRARQRKGNEFILEATREVAEKIDILIEQSKVGFFVPKDCHDILVETIETKEHLRLLLVLKEALASRIFMDELDQLEMYTIRKILKR